MILLMLFCLSRRLPLVTHVVDFYVFCIHLHCNARILHRISCPSHFICSVSIINIYIGNCYESKIHLFIFLYYFPCHLPSDPNTMSKHLHRFFHRLFWEKYRSLVLLELRHQRHFSREKNITSKGKSDKLEISIL